MLDWDHMQPAEANNPYAANITYAPIPTPSPLDSNQTGGYSYPPPPAKPSCFESKCNNCPFKDKCKNKE